MCTVTTDHTKQEATQNTKMITLDTKEPTRRIKETDQTKPVISAKSKHSFPNYMNVKNVTKKRNCGLISLMYTRTESERRRTINNNKETILLTKKKKAKIQKVHSTPFIFEYSYPESILKVQIQSICSVLMCPKLNANECSMTFYGLNYFYWLL